MGEQAAAVDLLDAAHRRDDRLVGRREDTALAAVLPASLAVLVPVLALVRLLLGGAVRAQERVGRNDVLDVGPMLWIERPVVRDRGRHFLVIPPRPVAERDLVGRVPDRARGRVVEEEPVERAAVLTGLEFARGSQPTLTIRKPCLGTFSWKEKFADAWPAFHLKFTNPSVSVLSPAVSPVAPAGCTQVCDAEVVSVPLKLQPDGSSVNWPSPFASTFFVIVTDERHISRAIEASFAASAPKSWTKMTSASATLSPVATFVPVIFFRRSCEPELFSALPTPTPKILIRSFLIELASGIATFSAVAFDVGLVAAPSS